MRLVAAVGVRDVPVLGDVDGVADVVAVIGGDGNIT